MSLEMKFAVTHLLMEVIGSKLQPCCFVFKTEHVYCCLEDFNHDSKFETYFNEYISTCMKKCFKGKIIGLPHLSEEGFSFLWFKKKH